MITKPRQRTIELLVILAAAFLLTGCEMHSLNGSADSTSPSPMFWQTGPSKPTTPSPKPTDANGEDSDEHHPSLWHKKLRAKYAMVGDQC